MFKDIRDILLNSDLGQINKRKPVLVVDSIANSLPGIGSSISADGLSITSIGERILFTNLSDSMQNNRIYEVISAHGSGATPLYELKLTTDGINADGSPAIGDLVQSLSGSSINELWAWDGSNWSEVSFSNFNSESLLSAPTVNGSSTQTLSVPGLLATDTILAVTQATSGTHNSYITQYDIAGDGQMTFMWNANPGNGTIVNVLVRHN